MHKITVNKLLSVDEGKQKYAPVKERILALRGSDHRYSLQTVVMFIKEANGWLATSTLTILDTGEVYTGNSFVAMNRGTFIQRNFPVEDAETSAEGRAFAAAGIGIDEAFASYEEMAKAKELAKTQPDQKVADAIHDLNKQIEKKNPAVDHGYGGTPACDIPAGTPYMMVNGEPAIVTNNGVPPTMEEVEAYNASLQPKYDDVEWVNHPEMDGEPETQIKPSDEPKLSEIPIPTREEIVAPDSPLVTGDWDKKPKTSVRKEVNKEITEKKLPVKSPKTLEEITGKGVTDHMKEVFVRLMEHGVNPFDYPERNTDKKFDAIEAAWNRGPEEFRAFIIQEFGIKFAAIHRSDVVEQEEFKAKKEPMRLDNGLTIAETIDREAQKYRMPEAKAEPKKEAPKVQPKEDTPAVVAETPTHSGGMQPNNNFLNQGKGGTMAQNFDATGNKFGFKIMPLADRSNPTMFTRWVIELVKKGVDIDLYETYFEKHLLSKDYASFESLLRTGTEEHINEFLNRH